MRVEPKTSFTSRRPIVIGIIIGCLIGLPIFGYFGIYQSTKKFSSSSPNTTVSQATVVDLKIRGNRNSRIYHLKGCPNYDDIAERNIVDFKTHEEAKASGYRMARNCL